MKKLGPLFRELRKEKQLTQKDTAKGIVSEAFLSNFERGYSSISQDNLFALLQRIKVSPDEFYRLTSLNSTTPMYDFINSLLPGIIDFDVIFLNYKLEELMMQKNKYDHVFYLHYKIIIEQSINFFAHTPLNTKDISIISQYLLKNNSWGNYEIQLYSHSIKFIPLDINKMLIKKAKKSVAKYVKKENYKHSVALLYISFIDLLLREKEFIFARDLIEDIMDYLRNTDYYYEINELTYLKGKLLIAEGQIEEGMQLAEKAIDTMYFLGSQKKAFSYKKCLKEFIESIKK